MIDIEQLAREAGRWASNQTGDTYEWNVMRDERFAALVRNEVLEEVASFVEVQRNDIPACGFEFAAAIRALKNKT
jgi:hypothetical protein